jgi:hypothetical protein
LEIYTIRELSTKTKAVCGAARGSEPAVITVNGKPAKMIIDIDGLDLEKQLKAFRQAQMMATVEAMRHDAASVDLSMEDIDEIVADVRNQRMR